MSAPYNLGLKVHMTPSMPLIRTIFLGLCVLFMTLFMTNQATSESFYMNLGIGIISGVSFGGALIILEVLFSKFKLRGITVAVLGLFLGYLLGMAITLTASKALELSGVALDEQTYSLVRACVFLACVYLGLVLTAKAAADWSLVIPFVELKSEASSKKNTLIVDTSILLDSRIIDLAASGLLDNRLIIPQFIIHEFQDMAESLDEGIRNKGRRSLETLKKLEAMPMLDLSFTDINYPELKSELPKLVKIAKELNSNVMIADNARLQQSSIDDVRLINIHSLSIVLKPLTQTGEPIDIKIQRYGKEPRQGVGYLDDGTMVVVNGGAEFIGETIRAQVLSVKHTSSGRMIFCNALDDIFLNEPVLAGLQNDAPPTPKNYFTV